MAEETIVKKYLYAFHVFKSFVEVLDIDAIIASDRMQLFVDVYPYVDTVAGRYHHLYEIKELGDLNDTT